MSAADIRLPYQPENRRFMYALIISLLFHAAILSLHFQFPEASKAMRERALDIILVNAKSERKPSKAQALAQANLDGGGDTDDDRRVKTPLPPTPEQIASQELEQTKRRLQQLEAKQQRMMTQARGETKIQDSRDKGEQPTPPSPVSGLDLLESARAMARLEGEVSKMTEEYNKRPRKKFIGASTQEYALAMYFDTWKQKVERIGVLNYPEAAKGKIYGEVVIYTELNVEDGSLRSAEIKRSSGHKILDQAALRVLRMAAPFGPIPRDAMDGATVLSFARSWTFKQGDQLSTENR